MIKVLKRFNETCQAKRSYFEEIKNLIDLTIGEFDHVDYKGKKTKCRSACEDQVCHRNICQIFKCNIDQLCHRNICKFLTLEFLTFLFLKKTQNISKISKVFFQVNSLFVTTSSYPNRKTLTYRCAI